MGKGVDPSGSDDAKQDDLFALIRSLENSDAFDYPVDSFQIVETHISYVLLTGPYAYKFKKHIDFGFLDFSSLENRKRFCEDELRLNARHAAELYLDVVKITGDVLKPSINGDGPVLEYAVKMVQFDRGQELDQLIRNDKLTCSIIDQLAQRVAKFHNQALPMDNTVGLDWLDDVYKPVAQNFAQIKHHLQQGDLYLKRLEILEDWSDTEFVKLKPVFKERKIHGFFRECHGDLHLGNIVLIKSVPVIFDCIEFSEALRCIDVINDLAFLVMDLHHHRRHEMAHRLLDAYLQETGDYSGLAVLRFYMIYRAMVRAKIVCIRMAQQQNRDLRNSEFPDYLDMAIELTQQQPLALFLMHGVSGTGKTTVSQLLLQRWGAIRIRSDVERKRVTSNATDTQTISADDLYSTSCIDKNYARLKELAALILPFGYSLIVDATFLRRVTRRDFMQLGIDFNIPVVILHCIATGINLEDRIQRRQKIGKDASDADLNVLAYQVETEERLTQEEYRHAIKIYTDNAVQIDAVIAKIKDKLGIR